MIEGQQFAVAKIRLRPAAHAHRWTDERLDLLKKLVREDELSCSQMAARLGGGLTRNAVIGKITRMVLRPVYSPDDLSQRCRRARKEGRGANMPRSVFVPGPMAAFATALTEWARALKSSEPASLRRDDGSLVTLLDAAAGECRWPRGEVGTAAFHLCGNRTEPEKSYCPFHAARAVQPNSSYRAWRERQVAQGLRAA